MGIQDCVNDLTVKTYPEFKPALFTIRTNQKTNGPSGVPDIHLRGSVKQDSNLPSQVAVSAEIMPTINSITN